MFLLLKSEDACRTTPEQKGGSLRRVRSQAPTNENPQISLSSFLIHTLPPSSPCPQMLRASTTAVRSSTRFARSFATVVDSASGAKVAAIDNGQPTSAVTFLVKAGSRFESKPGVAHALKNFAFKVGNIHVYQIFNTHDCFLHSVEHQHALCFGNREGVRALRWSFDFQSVKRAFSSDC